jgi:hypothetical protein
MEGRELVGSALTLPDTSVSGAFAPAVDNDDPSETENIVTVDKSTQTGDIPVPSKQSGSVSQSAAKVTQPERSRAPGRSSVVQWYWWLTEVISFRVVLSL